MTYYRFPDNKSYKICFVLLIMGIQLLTRSTMIANVFVNFVQSQLMMFGLILVAALVFAVVNRKNLKRILTDRRMIAVAAATVLILGNMVLKQDWRLMYFSILLCFYFAIFLTYFVTMREAAKCYVLIMLALGIYALLGQFVLKPMVHMGLLDGRPFDSPGGWHMFNFGLAFTVDKNTELDNSIRLFGIFREPGLYQIFLFIAIQLNNYTAEWKKQWQMWAVNAVLFAALLLTFATGGVIALGLYVVFLFFDKNLYKDKRICALAIALVVIGIIVVAVAIAQGGTWAMELVWVFQKITHGTDSYTDRVLSIIVNAQTFLQHPILGADIETALHAVTNNTATSPILFAAFGIVMGIVHVASWVALAWKKERSVLMNLFLLVILFLPFNTQNVIHDMFFWLFPVMALVERGLPLIPERAGKNRS